MGNLFLNSLFSKPVVTIKDVQTTTGLSTKAANDLVKAFTELKILREITGHQRNRIFIFDEYVRMF
jgi:Fic family protein